jgi:DNA-binding transcriptional regulator YbjK
LIVSAALADTYNIQRLFKEDVRTSDEEKIRQEIKQEEKRRKKRREEKRTEEGEKDEKKETNLLVSFLSCTLTDKLRLDCITPKYIRSAMESGMA